MEKIARQPVATQIALLILLAVTVSGCEAIGTIFKAGGWVGVIAVVLVILLLGFIVSKIRR